MNLTLTPPPDATSISPRTGLVDPQGDRLAMYLEDGGPTPKSTSPSRSAMPAGVADATKRRTVDLSALPGRSRADNYVGVVERDADGRDITTQVRLQAIVAGTPEHPQVVGINAVGPVISVGGRIVSERGKVYLLKDSAGRPITDPEAAKNRTREFLHANSFTTTTFEQAAYMKAAGDRRAAEIDRVRLSVSKAGAMSVKAPGLNYSNNAGRPNRIDGNAPKPRQVERGGFDVKWHTESDDPSPTFSAMIVPNIVGELGPKKAAGKPGSGYGVTPQPFTGFFPVGGGFEGFHTESENRAFYRSTLHPAGFYPGDPDWGRWHDYLKNDPATAPEYRVSNYGHASKIHTENWWQVYWNSPNLLAPWAGGSLNARAIKWRDEVRAGLYSQQDTTAGRSDTQWLLAPYAWGQVHAKGGVANAALPVRTPYGTVGAQGEVGGYLYLNTNPLSSPFGKVDPAKLKVKDWHIVNGVVTDDHAKFMSQFSAIGRRTGLQLLSESVVPDWNDRSAGVYLQVPATGAGSADWAARVQGALVEVQGQRFLPVDRLVDLMHGLAREMPKYKELGFVTAKTLERLNAGRIATMKDPHDGHKMQAFAAGTWIDTGSRVSVGGPGLFLPDDVAAGR